MAVRLEVEVPEQDDKTASDVAMQAKRALLEGGFDDVTVPRFGHTDNDD